MAAGLFEDGRGQDETTMDSCYKGRISGTACFDGLPEGFSIKTGVPDIIDWIENRGAEFVTSVTREQKNAIKALLEKSIVNRSASMS